MNTRKFTGPERDLETGLDYMMARYYSASMGRFLSVDPFPYLRVQLLNRERFQQLIRDPLIWNKYTYVSNNPVNSVDETGQREKKKEDQFPSVGDEIWRALCDGMFKHLCGYFEAGSVATDLQLIYDIRTLSNELFDLWVTTGDTLFYEMYDKLKDLESQWGKYHDNPFIRAQINKKYQDIKRDAEKEKKKIKERQKQPKPKPNQPGLDPVDLRGPVNGFDSGP